MPLISTPETVLPAVLSAIAAAPNARHRTLMNALVRHLHAYVLETQLSEAEFELALRFLVDIGKATGDTKNEVVLAADLLGVSTLVTLLNNPGAGGESTAALLGPFWRGDAPFCKPGDSIARGDTPGRALEVRGIVCGPGGEGLAGAIVDTWQASPIGLYENQDLNQPDMNLRGRFTSDQDGSYFFRTVMPAGYPVPTDGPCGKLLRAQCRHPDRPAHLHFMVSKPGYRVHITQVFADTEQNLARDPVFGATRALVGRFEIGSSGTATLHHDFLLAPGDTVFPHPPIP